jgi:hypothetical protein
LRDLNLWGADVTGHFKTSQRIRSWQRTFVGQFFGPATTAALPIPWRRLHGWFRVLGVHEDGRRFQQELRVIIPALGCDEKMFGMSQPTRLPGAVRDGRRQRLPWFSPA